MDTIHTLDGSLQNPTNWFRLECCRSRTCWVTQNGKSFISHLSGSFVPVSTLLFELWALLSNHANNTGEHVEESRAGGSLTIITMYGSNITQLLLHSQLPLNGHLVKADTSLEQTRGVGPYHTSVISFISVGAGPERVHLRGSWLYLLNKNSLRNDGFTGCSSALVLCISRVYNKEINTRKKSGKESWNSAGKHTAHALVSGWLLGTVSVFDRR